MEQNAHASISATVLKMSMNPNGRKVLRCFKGAQTDAGATKVAPLLVDIVVVSAASLAIVSIIVSQVLVTNITGYCLIGFCPFVAFQKRQLLKLGTLREQLNVMRKKVNRFMLLNDNLKKEVDALSATVTRLEDVENQLAQHANTDKENLQELVDIVKRRKEVNARMNDILETTITQELITAVLFGDFNNDMKIGPREFRSLIMNLENKKGFDFNKELFIQMIGDTKEHIPIEKVMEIIRNLKNHSLKKEDSVFVIKPGQVLEQ